MAVSIDSSSPATKLVNVSCKDFEFTHSVTRAQLKITNAAKARVSWRLRCNAPASYIVCPNSGFLAADESVTVEIELAEVKKRRRKGHRFVLQTMEAERSDVDRRKIWLSERAQESKNICNIRLRSTFKSDTSLNSSSDVPTSLFSSYDSSGSKVQTANLSSVSSESRASSSSLPNSDDETKNYKEIIDKLSTEIRSAIVVKKNLSTDMVAVINEIKRVEMDLDKLQSTTKEWESKIQQKSAELEELRKRASN